MTKEELEEANQLQKNLFAAKEKMGDIDNFKEKSKENVRDIAIDFEMPEVHRTFDLVISASELKEILEQIQKMRKNAFDTAAYHFDNFLK